MKARERSCNGQSDGIVKRCERGSFAILTSPMVMRIRTFLFITALMLCHPQLWPQTLTKQFPSQAPGAAATGSAESNLAVDSVAAPQSPQGSLPDAPGYPIAEVVEAPPSGVPVVFRANQQEKHGDVFTLTGEVRIEYKDYILTADKVAFNRLTSDAEADGHVRLEGKRNNELILADHGKLNFDLETGRFENVTGSVGRQPSASKRKLIYTTANPFLFTGRVLIKEGPERYQIFQGTMTSCLLPDPDWRIHASQIRVNYGEASAKNSYFTLLGVPILYLPYVTHPVSTETRETGLLIPAFTLFSSTKGTVVGDSIYLVFNRSMDLTIGTQYFSKRGWSPSGEFRYHGREDDFGDARFTALFDRGLAPIFINEGGQDIVVNGRHDFDPDERTRAVANGEYLSSYVYRQSFAESFAQGIASQVQSLAFITHNVGGVSSSVRFDRYQNFEGMTLVGNTYDTPQISILRLPRLDFDTVDRAFGPSALGAALEWGVDGSAAGVSRSEPGYATGEVGRFDLYPLLSLPLHLDGWTLRPEVGARETYYSQSQIPTYTTPVVGNATVNRSDLEASFELRPPPLVRDFKAPALERLFDSDLRHTIEVEIQYRFVAGVNNFSFIPRFDSTDVVSDTNEVEYSLTQRLFLRHLRRKPCSSGDLPKPISGIIYIPWAYTECGGDTNEWITCKLAAKYFFDPTFGGAIPPPPRNNSSTLYATAPILPYRRTVLTSSLDLTAVAFLGVPRNDSPLISRFKVRTSRLLKKRPFLSFY